MSEPGREPECWQVPARSPKDLPWRCRQERRRKLWPATQEVQALLWALQQLPARGRVKVFPALPSPSPNEGKQFFC